MGFGSNVQDGELTVLDVVQIINLIIGKAVGEIKCPAAADVNSSAGVDQARGHKTLALLTFRPAHLAAIGQRTFQSSCASFVSARKTAHTLPAG
eukprot:scaffold1186_cov399-Prasinococcus_capsulatus_cf.AAC.7